MNIPTVADMTLDELRQFVIQTVYEALQILDKDPDIGLSLRPEIAARLTQRLADEKVGKTPELLSHETVLKELGLDE